MTLDPSQNSKFDSWRSAGYQVAVLALGTDGFRDTAEVFIRHYSKSERIIRAVKGFFGCLVLGIIAAFIPFIHIVALPLFFLGAPIIALVFYRTGAIILGGLANCPFCHKQTPLMRALNRWPIFAVCHHCDRQYRIEKERSDEAAAVAL